MNKKTQQNITYYLLAILGILLIVLPFFFLDFSTDSLANTAARLGLHAVAFGGAVVTAGFASTVVVKAIQHPGFAKVASWSVAAITATSLTVAALYLSTGAASPSSELVMQDSILTDSNVVATVADSLSNATPTDSASLLDRKVEVQTTEKNATIEQVPTPSFTETKKTIPAIAKSEVKEADKSGAVGNCKDEDVAVFLSGKKVNLTEGFSYGNKSKNIRIGDECGCTASNTKITVTEKSGRMKAEKIISTPFFSLQGITTLDATDRVVAEVDQVKCINKEGISSLKKIKKMIFNIVFKNDGSETIVRKRAAKELQTTEETTPVKKNAVEEDALKYGN